MSDILQAIGGTLLLGIPVSFLLTIFYIPTYQRMFGDMRFGDFALAFVLMYFCLLLFAAVGFAGIAGIAMMMGAFR